MIHLSSKPSNNSITVVFLLAALFTFSMFTANTARQVEAQTLDLAGVSIAVWGGITSDSTTAVQAMFEWMNAEVTLVTSSQIRGGALDSVDIFAVPGVSETSTIALLEEEGREAIRQFVEAGGSYFGICGGALTAVNPSLHLYDGTLTMTICGSGSSLGTITVNQLSTGPGLATEPSTYQTTFWGPQYFTAQGVTGLVTIATYESNGHPSMIVYEYGSGNVFLSSPHPEFEEGDSRDGTTLFDEFNDPDSEWNFMQKIARWQVDTSPDNDQNTGPQGIPIEVLLPIIAAGAIIVAVVVLVSYFVKKRRGFLIHPPNTQPHT
ncbi:MAG: BPL-N domain-containing protein [Promethearchaeota archaeon]